MNKQELFLFIERRINTLLWSSFVILLITGLTNWIFQTHSFITLWFSVFHGIAGVFFSIAVLAFGYVHFRRTIGFRRPMTLVLGIFGWFALLGLIYSGMMMLWHGRREADSFLFNSHLSLACIGLALVVIHLLAYYWVVAKKQKSSEIFPSLDALTRKAFYIVAGAATAAIGVSTLVSLNYDPEFTTKPVSGEYVYDYGSHPFRPSQTETYHDTFIDSREIATSSECSVCHQDVAQQWVDSTHKKAASDPTYVRNINLLATNKGITATRYCEGCHAPIALLTGALSPGGFHGGQSNTHANREGVNCMSCHGIQTIEHLKGNASYRYGPGKPYLFESADNNFLKAINRLSIRLAPEQHKRDMARDITSKAEFCATCHAQFMDKEMNNWGWVKMQDDYSSWLNGPYSAQNPRFNLAEAIPCQSCHMPKVAAQDPSADSQGFVKSHRFLGANTLTAALSDSPEQLQETIRFLQTNKMRITIDRPNRESATQNYAPLENQLRDTITAPYFYYLNEKAKLSVTVSNIGVGHNFPGGTIDINEAWIELIITDAQGAPIYSSGTLDAKQEVDPKAYFYRSMPVDRKGKDVWKHDLFNMIGDRYRNSVPPGGADIASFDFEVPNWAISPIQVSAALKYRKLNKKYTAWALENDGISLPVVDVARDSLLIPLKRQPDVHQLVNK
jgi:hypothetical protein